MSKYICQMARYEIYGYFWIQVAYVIFDDSQTSTKHIDSTNWLVMIHILHQSESSITWRWFTMWCESIHRPLWNTLTRPIDLSWSIFSVKQTLDWLMDLRTLTYWNFRVMCDIRYICKSCTDRQSSFNLKCWFEKHH